MTPTSMLCAALLAALGSVAVMAQTNVYSVNAIGGGESVARLADIKSIGAVIPLPTTYAPLQSLPSFQEVYQVLSTNLEGVSTNDLNSAAVLGLIHQLDPRVSLAGSEVDVFKAAPLADERVFDKFFAYVRVAAVTSNLPDAFRAGYRQLTETNTGRIKGLVLDLRFATGFDYAAAAKLADCFLSSEHPLLNWQSGSAQATLKTDAITIPVSILVNSQTAGAAEALAAVLRDNEAGLIIGTQTRGQASVFKEFTLHDGSKLLVAVAPVSFGAGKTLTQGVTPDIAIATSLEDERAYLQNPCKILHPSEVSKTESIAKPAPEEPRLNEVGLIRRHKSGEDDDEFPARTASSLPEPSPTVADPALARALDLLKGLAVVQPNRTD